MNSQKKTFNSNHINASSANLTELREENVSLREDIAKIKKEHQQEMKKLKSKKPQVGRALNISLHGFLIETAKR